MIFSTLWLIMALAFIQQALASSCPSGFVEASNCECYAKTPVRHLQPNAAAACASMGGAEWVRGWDIDENIAAINALGFGSFWTDAVLSGNTYNFSNGAPVENDGVLLDPETGRPYVIFARKNYVYQRKEADREFLVLCKKGMTNNCEGPCYIPQIQVRSSADNSIIAGAIVEMSIGGNVVYSEVSDSNGYAPVADVACDVEVSIQVNRVGYVETTTTLMSAVDDSGLQIFFINPEAPAGVTTAVLSWDLVPGDLDWHIRNMQNNGAGLFYTCETRWNNRNCPNSQLDQDRTSQYNPRPETITMTLFNGWHIMWVYDYNRSNNLYTNNPVVNVFTGNSQIASLTPPPQPANTVINYWYIGCLNGNSNVFIPINTVSTNLDLNPYTAYMCYV